MRGISTSAMTRSIDRLARSQDGQGVDAVDAEENLIALGLEDALLERPGRDGIVHHEDGRRAPLLGRVSSSTARGRRPPGGSRF